MLEKLVSLKLNKKFYVLWSCVCLLLCCSLLIGTTYAWFTDSAASKNNRIVSGKLELSADYRKLTISGNTVSATGWADVNGSDEILAKDALYQPGYLDVTLFRIKNTGNLSLKYQLALLKENEIKGYNIKGQWYNLSDYLKFKFITLDENTFIKKSEALKASPDLSGVNRDSITGLVNDVQTGFNIQHTVEAVMGPKEDSDGSEFDVIALVIMMPEAGNDFDAENAMYDANVNKVPSVTFDFKIVATQYTGESDSFGNDYDVQAVYQPEWSAFQYIKGDLASELNCYNSDGAKVVSVRNEGQSQQGTLIVSECNTPVGFNVVSDTYYKSYNISVRDDNGEAIPGNYNVSMYVGKGLTNVKIYHNGFENQDINDFTYNYDTGYASFKTTTFSVFTVSGQNAVASVDSTFYGTLKDGVAAAISSNKSLVLLAKQMTVDETIKILPGKTLEVDLNGCVLNSTVSRVFNNYGTLTIKDSSAHSSGTISTSGDLVLNDVTDFPQGLISTNSNAVTTIDGCSLSVNANVSNCSSQYNVFNVSNSTLRIINGSKIYCNIVRTLQEAGNGTTRVINASGSNVNISNCEITAINNHRNMQSIYTNECTVSFSNLNLNVNNSGSSFTINNNTFYPLLYGIDLYKSKGIISSSTITCKALNDVIPYGIFTSDNSGDITITDVNTFVHSAQQVGNGIIFSGDPLNSSKMYLIGDSVVNCTSDKASCVGIMNKTSGEVIIGGKTNVYSNGTGLSNTSGVLTVNSNNVLVESDVAVNNNSNSTINLNGGTYKCITTGITNMGTANVTDCTILCTANAAEDVPINSVVFLNRSTKAKNSYLNLSKCTVKGKVTGNRATIKALRSYGVKDDGFVSYSHVSMSQCQFEITASDTQAIGISTESNSLISSIDSCSFDIKAENNHAYCIQNLNNSVINSLTNTQFVCNALSSVTMIKNFNDAKLTIGTGNSADLKSINNNNVYVLNHSSSVAVINNSGQEIPTTAQKGSCTWPSES